MKTSRNRPTTERDVLPVRIENAQASRVSEAQFNCHVYEIVAFDPARGRIYLKRPQSVPRRVTWGNLTCDCPDTLTLSKLEEEARESGMGDVRLLCKHCHLVTEVVSRKLAEQDKSLVDFCHHADPVIAALPVAYPNLPCVPPPPPAKPKLAAFPSPPPMPRPLGLVTARQRQADWAA